MESKFIRKRLSTYLREILEEQIQVNGKTETNNSILAKEFVRIAKDGSLPDKLRLEAILAIFDRMEGKPVNTNLNAEVSANPFDGVDTAKLEALRAKLTEGKEKEGKA